MEETEIEKLLPHRNPFLYVDELLSVSEDEIIGTKVFESSNGLFETSFPNVPFVPGPIIVESLAQCGGAGVNKMGLIKGLFGLANIEMANYHTKVGFKKEIKLVIKNLKLSERIIRQSGIAYLDGIPAMEATWTCVRMNPERAAQG